MCLFSLKKTLFSFSLSVLSLLLSGQENIFTHYFSANSFYNPSMAGDTRFAQAQLNERIQPTVSNLLITNTLFSFDHKLQNHRSGIGVYINRRTSIFSETQMRSNFSHTILLFKKVWVKGGLGISLNTINTHASTYKFPDQYDRYGYTGNPTHEPSLNEKAVYAGFSAGLAIYYEQGWLSIASDNINRPVVDYAGTESRTPLLFSTTIGYLFPIDKGKKAKRMFTRYGEIEPYSNVGPVASFFKNGDFQILSFGINAFMRPVFWGIQYRFNSVYNQYLSEGVSSVNLMAGYRNDILSIAYSYDFVVNRTPTNYKGAHEISLIYYFYTIKEDYKKYKLFPYPNQLMY